MQFFLSSFVFMHLCTNLILVQFLVCFFVFLDCHWKLLLFLLLWWVIILCAWLTEHNNISNNILLHQDRGPWLLTGWATQNKEGGLELLWRDISGFMLNFYLLIRFFSLKIYDFYVFYSSIILIYWIFKQFFDLSVQ